MQEKVDWSEDDCPHSPRFGDVYRARAGGLQQARTVFVQGCHVAQRWAGASQFCILETGFGLGLNFLATWEAWRADAKRCAQLHYVAIEAYPVAAADVLRSAQVLAPNDSPWMAQASALADAWSHVQPGVQHWVFEGGALRLTLAIGHVMPMLQELDCTANAVYLDGFSPAKNPDMWSPATLQAVAAHCQPGSTLATYTVAATVRHALTAAGFKVRRRPGVPPKWHRLEGVFEHPAAAPA